MRHYRAVTPDWTRLGRLVRERRQELGLAQGQEGPSSATWRKVEGAVNSPYRVATLRTISLALGWTANSAERILDGLDPIIPDAPLNQAPPDLAAQVALLQREVAELRRLLEARTKTG